MRQYFINFYKIITTSWNVYYWYFTNFMKSAILYYYKSHPSYNSISTEEEFAVILRHPESEILRFNVDLVRVSWHGLESPFVKLFTMR